MATKQQQPEVIEVDKELVKLRESIGSFNPFDMNRVTGAYPLKFDVPSIHRVAFAKLTQMAVKAQSAGLGIGATLLGAPGVGKSHLLARLARWAIENNACYVYLHNIQAAPEDIGRYLVKCCVAQLAEDRLERLDQTFLFRIVNSAIHEAAKKENITSVNRTNRADVFKRLASRLGGDADIFHVIFLFFENVLRTLKALKSGDVSRRDECASKAAVAVRWLKGDWIDATELKILNIPHGSDKNCDRLPDESVLAVILMIARLARESACPFVLCLDQVDTMRLDRLKSLFIELHHLLDGQSLNGQREVSNLLVVVSGVEEDMRALHADHAFPDASAARLNFDDAISLHGINCQEVRELFRDRLHQFADHYPRLIPSKAFFQNDELFPLGEPWFHKSFGEPRIQPRVAISRARLRWQQIQSRLERETIVDWLKSWRDFEGQLPAEPVSQQQRMQLIDKTVRLKHAEGVNARRLQSGTLPADAGNLLSLTRTLLEHCVDRNEGYSLHRIEAARLNTKIDLAVSEKNGKLIRNHAQFIVTDSKTSAAARLRNLLESDQDCPVDCRLVITDDERMPLQLGAAGLRYLNKLEKLGEKQFVNVKMKFEQYAQLDAMVAVMNSAQAGDLEIETSPGQFDRVQREEVIESFHRLDTYRSHVLLQHFLTEPTESIELREEQSDVELTKALREFIIHKLSLEMGANLSQLLHSFCVSRKCSRDPNVCNEWARKTVVAMNAERVISAKPWDDDFYLTSL